MHPWLSNNGTAFVMSDGTTCKRRGATELTSIKRTTNCGDDDLKSQERAHAKQHGAVLVVDAVDSDGMDHFGKLFISAATAVVNSRTGT